MLGPGDPSTSGGSNKGGFNADLLKTVTQRRELIAARERADPAAVPPDAVTASGSGVDPRPKTAALLEELEMLPRRTVIHREVALTELDVDAVLARHPQVVLVDELAHTNAPGSRNPKRWQDVEEILAAGITVLSTVNVQHLESVNDVVERITGILQQETVPDEVVRRAEQVELVDITPEALRRRLAHGNVYNAEKLDAALANYFQPGNLIALRELALLWVADQVDIALQRYRTDQKVTDVWETRERVAVALTGGAESETVLRRAARIAKRSGSAELLAVHVLRGDGLAGASASALAKLRRLADDAGASFHTVVGDDVPAALLDFARGVNATQLVLGTSRRSRLARTFAEGIGARVVQDSGPEPGGSCSPRFRPARPAPCSWCWPASTFTCRPAGTGCCWERSASVPCSARSR